MSNKNEDYVDSQTATHLQDGPDAEDSRKAALNRGLLAFLKRFEKEKDTE